jgi:hypothetical protein
VPVLKKVQSILPVRLRAACAISAGVLVIALLCGPQSVRADAYTSQQLTNDVGIVDADIAGHALAFAMSPVAQNDYAAGLTAASLGIVFIALNDNTDAQKEFTIAVNDYNGVLLALGLSPLAGGSGVPEPSSLLQLSLGAVAVAIVGVRRQRREKPRRAAA